SPGNTGIASPSVSRMIAPRITPVLSPEPEGRRADLREIDVVYGRRPEVVVERAALPAEVREVGRSAAGDGSEQHAAVSLARSRRGAERRARPRGVMIKISGAKLRAAAGEAAAPVGCDRHRGEEKSPCHRRARAVVAVLVAVSGAGRIVVVRAVVAVAGV